LGRLGDKLRTTFSRLVLEWGNPPRYTVSLPIEFKILSSGNGKSSRLLKGVSYDLSVGGLAILSDTATSDGLHVYFSNDMTTEQKLEITLQLPEKSIKILGQTCRYLKTEPTKQPDFSYLLGVKIVNMETEDRKAYDDYLYKLKQSVYKE
jgi:c-di-GMP-binding flagellar brake protein YcgR